MVLEKVTPFLKWVGGKRSIIAELKLRLPQTFKNYYEPFVGGGALFFEVSPTIKKAFLSDANSDLITTYEVIKNNPSDLISLLKKHQKLHCSEYYYLIRSRHGLLEPVEIAARLIYLNKTCFNGLYRVNSKGEFNVPMGAYKNPGIVQQDNVMACTEALSKAVITNQDYSKIRPKAGDLVYIDPPYHPVSETASFTAYAANGFNEKNQQELADFCKSLHNKGVKVMVSNSNTPFIRALYSNPIFKIGIVNAPRMVNCKANGRKAVEEVLITNY
jgi:DNA adenine methylase